MDNDPQDEGHCRLMCRHVDSCDCCLSQNNSSLVSAAQTEDLLLFLLKCRFFVFMNSEVWTEDITFYLT